MGVKDLSKLLRDCKAKPDVFATDARLKGKRVGVDLSVVLHKALATNDGASYYHIEPPNPNGEVIEKCTRLCSWANCNDITFVVSVDGRYHSMKGNVNKDRDEGRDVAQDKLNELLHHIRKGSTYSRDSVFKLMKKAVKVDAAVLSTAVDVFRTKGHEVYGAPYESDFQLVYWEMSKFTDATYSTDSDLYAMGCRLVIDLLDFNSAKGNCVILEREKVQGRIMKDSDKWSDFDTILFSAISGCDFVPKLLRAKKKEMAELMRQYKDHRCSMSLLELLTNFAKGRVWPSRERADDDYAERVMKCIGLMMYAPATAVINGKCTLTSIRPLPPGKSWSELIGFDPLFNFSDEDVANSYSLKIWARSGEALPTIPLPQDADDTTRKLPHGSVIDFKKTPVDLCPSTLLLQWLFYHGVHAPKSLARKELVETVSRAYDIDQPLDESRIQSQDTVAASSWISFDTIILRSDVVWVNDTNEILNHLRGHNTPKISHDYINLIFGEGKNGIRNRAWLRLESGHLDMGTLKMAEARVEIDGKDTPVIIYSLKVTPSMKNVVYGVYIVFSDEGVYMPKLSKCDCPNGWLFCSHTLAMFLLVYLIQQKVEWTLSDLLKYLPEPIKSLQNLPLAASQVFGDLEVSKPGSKKGAKKDKKGSEQDSIKSTAKSIAKNIPGYSKNYEVNNADAIEETKLIREAMHEANKNVCNCVSVDLCQRLDEKLKDIELREVTNKSKVSIEDINNYNNGLVNSKDTDKEALQKMIRHERLYRMMKDGHLTQNKTIWAYLHHFAAEREGKIEELSLTTTIPPGDGPSVATYSADYLAAYFAEDDE